MEKFTATLQDDAGETIAEGVNVLAVITGTGPQKAWAGAFWLATARVLVPGKYRLIETDGRQGDIVIGRMVIGDIEYWFTGTGPFE